MLIQVSKRGGPWDVYWHDDVIKWKHFPRYWPFVRGIHRSPVNSPHKSQCHGALMFSLICARINGWVNNREAGDLRRHRGHYGVSVMRHQWLNRFHSRCPGRSEAALQSYEAAYRLDPSHHLSMFNAARLLASLKRMQEAEILFDRYVILSRYGHWFATISNRMFIIIPLFNMGLYSLSGRTSYRKISWCLEAARFGFRLFQSFWNLTGTSAAALPICLSNVRAIRSL